MQHFLGRAQIKMCVRQTRYQHQHLIHLPSFLIISLNIIFKSFLKHCVDLPLLVSKHISKRFYCSSSVKQGSAI